MTFVNLVDQVEQITKHDPDLEAEANVHPSRMRFTIQTQFIDENIHLFPQAGDLSSYTVNKSASRFLLNHQKKQKRKGYEVDQQD